MQYCVGFCQTSAIGIPVLPLGRPLSHSQWFLIILGLHRNPARETLSPHLTRWEGLRIGQSALEVTQLMVKRRLGIHPCPLSGSWLLSYPVFMAPNPGSKLLTGAVSQKVALQCVALEEGQEGNHGFAGCPRTGCEGYRLE